eukprot:scaffold241559_cov27-Tisochrysis_lutea.AAC.3
MGCDSPAAVNAFAAPDTRPFASSSTRGRLFSRMDGEGTGMARAVPCFASSASALALASAASAS